MCFAVPAQTVEILLLSSSTNW